MFKRESARSDYFFPSGSPFPMPNAQERSRGINNEARVSAQAGESFVQSKIQGM